VPYKTGAVKKFCKTGLVLQKLKTKTSLTEEKADNISA